MLNGYVTYDELSLITGFNDRFLKTFIKEGILEHKITITKSKKFTQNLYDLKEVEEWLKIWL